MKRVRGKSGNSSRLLVYGKGPKGKKAELFEKTKDNRLRKNPGRNQKNKQPDVYAKGGNSEQHGSFFPIPARKSLQLRRERER